MSLPNEILPVGLLGTSATTTYNISRSLRFNSPDSAFLSRTPGSAGNRKTWTWAGWVKRTKLGAQQMIFSAYGAANDTDFFSTYFLGSDTIYVAGWNTGWLTSTPVFRDASAWYHLVFSIDTTQTTATSRIRVYVNGSEITTWGQDNRTLIPQNANLGVNAAVVHTLAKSAFDSSNYADFLLADIHFIDGQALDPTSFGQFNATTSVWVPKQFTGSYGTQGWKLDFADNSAATAAALGKDTSGNGNNWTPNNLSVTAGAGNDSLVDVPTNGSQTDTGAGGEVRGNYCVINPILGSIGTVSNGNLDVTTGATINHRRGTIGVSSGKWYWEITPTSSSDLLIGVVRDAASYTNTSTGYPGGDANGWGYYQNNGNKYNGSASAYGASYTTNDVIGVALDADAGTLTYYKNGVSQGQAFSNVTSGPFFPAIGNGSAVDRSYTANFGQRPFAYTAPSGFKALCTANLPAPLVTKSSTVFDTVLWTGNGSSQSITGLGFSPDLVWTKMRNDVNNHWLFDTIRGTEQGLASSSTTAELTRSGTITAFNSDGFTTSSSADTNQSTKTYAAWCWDAGSTTVTNTQGSITSSVRANATAGFSIVTYTGNGTNNATVGHGLGIAPELILFKRRSTTAQDWGVYHVSGGRKALQLNTTNAYIGGGATYWDAIPTSSVFYPDNVYVSDHYQNVNTATYVAYCFAPVAGYSSMGSYVGTGTSSGSFVYTGFRPRLVICKPSNATGNWTINDSARDPANGVYQYLFADASNAEASYLTFDFLSNGFRAVNTGANHNASGVTYIYYAVAESPFQYSRAR